MSLNFENLEAVFGVFVEIGVFFGLVDSIFPVKERHIYEPITS